MQAVFVLMKLEGSVSSDWVTVFWITWVFLITFTFYLLGLTILLLTTVVYYFVGDAELFHVIGLVWSVSSFFCIDISLFWIFSSFRHFENTKKPGKNLNLIKRIYILHWKYILFGQQSMCFC